MHQPSIAKSKWIKWQELGVKPSLKDHVGGLSNRKSCFVTLLSLKQQKITQNRKLSKPLQATEIIIGFATLFVIYRTKKNPITTTKFINQQHNLLILCCVLQHSLLFAKPKETLKITKQIPSYSQAKNYCSLVMTLLLFAKKNQNKNPRCKIHVNNPSANVLW